MQFKKLAVICNICFWLLIGFQYWKPAAGIQKDLLNTILILGMVAVFINAVWVIYAVKKKQLKMQEVLSCFITLSFIGQLIFLSAKYL